MRRNNLSDEEKMLVDAVLFDKGNLDQAFKTKSNSSTERKEILHKMALRWWRSPLVVEYRKTRSNAGASAGEETQERSKADIVAELNRLISLESDNKRRGDLLMKLSDLLRDDPSAAGEAETHNTYYLPLRCSECSLWRQFNESQRGERPREKTQR